MPCDVVWPRAVAAVAIATVAAWPAQAGATVSASRIARMVSTSGVAATTSLVVARRDGSTIYARSATTLRIPASNEKVLTMVTAFQVLGPGFRFTTRAVMAGDVLYLVGSGDPTLTSARLGTLARRVRAAGVTRVARVVADGTRFDTVRGVPGWQAGFSPQECAPMSGIAVDGDRARSKPVWKPERRAAVLFRSLLRKSGVTVAGAAGTGVAAAGAIPVASVQSRPLATVLRAAGKDSDNFTAEMVLKAVAAAAGRPGTTRAGAGIVRATMRARGLDVSQIRTADGSGLSRHDRVTSAFMVALFRSALDDPTFGAAFADALAIAGVDGTLERRMTRPPALGVLRGKTGTLNVASALTAEAPGYVFSIITNGAFVNATATRKLQDRIGQLVARG